MFIGSQVVYLDLTQKKSDLHFSMSALESEIKLREGQPLQIFAGFWNYLAKIEIF